MAKESPFASIIEDDVPDFARPLSNLEVEQIERQEDEKESTVTFAQAAKAAYEQDNIMAYLFRDSPEREYDPNFRLTDELFEKATVGIPTEYVGFTADAVSEDHLMGLRENVLASLENEKKLAEYGWSGFALRVGASVLDPAAVAATVATDGIASFAIWGGKATRLANALRGGASGLVANAAIESYLVSQNDVKDAYDILYGATGGLLLGGAFGGLVRGSRLPEYEDALESWARDAHLGQLNDYANSPNLRERLSSTTSLPDTFDGTDVRTPTVNLQGERPDLFPNIRPEDNPWVARNDVDSLRAGEADYVEIARTAPFAYAGNIRFSIAGQGKSSPVNTIRSLTGDIVEDAVGRNQGNELMRESAERIKRDELKALQNEYYSVYGPAYEDWINDTGKTLFGLSGLAKRAYIGRQEFGELVTAAVRSPRQFSELGDEFHPAVIRAARKQAELQERMLVKMQEAGVKGMETIPTDRSYMTRRWNAGKMFDDRYPVSDVIEAIQKGITRANRDIDDELALVFAKAFVKRFREERVGIDQGLFRIFATDSEEVLRDILIEERLLSPENAQKLVDILSEVPAGMPAMAMRRFKMDMDTPHTTQNGNTIRLSEFTDNDAEQLFLSYSNQSMGMMALARVGIKSDGDFTKLLNIAKSEMDTMNLSGKQLKREQGNIENLQVAYDLIRGRSSPLQDDPNTNFARTMRVLMDMNFLRLMGQVGFAQVAELGNALALGGLRGMAQAIPSIPAMVRRSRNGEISDELMREIEMYTGYGADRHINRYANRRDIDAYYEGGRGDLIDTVTDVLQPMKRVLADVSGMSWITLGLEKMTARIIVQNFTDMAYGARRANMDRLKGLGIDERMSERIFEHIRSDRVSKVESALFNNRKIKKPNLHLWEPDVREAFLRAITRSARQSIQQNDIGNLNRYMTKTSVQVITQFRTFALVSYEKQFLHNIAARDAQAAMAMLYSTYFAGLSYAAQTGINSIGRDDRDEFLEERLSYDEIAKAAFQRSSYASLFPAMIDTGAMFFIEDPIFAYGRTTGLSSNLLSGIPAVDFIDDSYKAATGASQALFNPDVQWSKGHQRAFNSIIPFQNATGIRNAFNYMVDLAPESKRVE